MGTSTRKQREVQLREQLLLDVGRRMLIEQGFAGLSLDRLAEATEYSKGTIYQHFSTKEDLVVALAAQSTARRLELFHRADRATGGPRERMVAVAVADELFARLHPHYFRSELIVKMADLEIRASADRLDIFNQVDRVCFEIVRSLIAEAVAVGDLRLRPDQSPESMLFALYAFAVGSHTMMLNHSRLLQQWQIDEPFQTMFRNVQTLLDGFGMRPLAAERDYEAIRLQILREVFPDESRAAGLS